MRMMVSSAGGGRCSRIISSLINPVEYFQSEMSQLPHYILQFGPRLNRNTAAPIITKIRQRLDRESVDRDLK